MTTFEKIICAINGIYFFLIAYLLAKYVSAITALLTNTMGLLFLLLFFLLPLVLGIVFSLKYISRKKKMLSRMESILIAFPIINWAIILGFILFASLSS